MIDLKDALDILYEFDDLRERAKKLREAARKSIAEIESNGAAGGGVKFRPSGLQRADEWISSANSVEVALLVKVQNHKDLSVDDTINDQAEASGALKDVLESLTLEKNLFAPRPQPDEEMGDRRIPVLVAARAMQALVSRSKTVLSRATLLSYYRIVRELYIAAPPDWTVGAARANKGGTTAFVTGECIRAIFAFGDAMDRTANFFRQTRRLAGRYDLLCRTKTIVEDDQASDREVSNGPQQFEAGTPVDDWANKSIERMWFDWYISTSPRDGDIALHTGGETNELFFSPSEAPNLDDVQKYLNELVPRLLETVQLSKVQVAEAIEQIKVYRGNEAEELRGSKDAVGNRRRRDYDRAESAHKFALGLIEGAAKQAEAVEKILSLPRNEALERLAVEFRRIASDVHRVLEPARRYVRTVIHREVAASASGRFDAGELVFAAASFGAMTKWKSSELLTKACTLLVTVLAENGRLPTTRPFHSTPRGHRMLPIGCEMTRSFAQLLQRTTEYEVEPKVVRRMLNIFEEKAIRLDGDRVAWNFDGSPEPDKPCLWVTAVSVLALDRIMRMLNDRINLIVFRYFEVVRPADPEDATRAQQGLNLNDLIYPDHDLSNHKQQRSMAVRLEQMRAHLRRVTPPTVYKDERAVRERVYSAIFYGPPGTGKTTLVEALALSSQVPLIRLSPSDLVVQGPAAIEARARFVFEALSMLTQVVIILDEFEDVVGKRVEKGREHEEKIFQFLRMGMLPKLVKLNKAARNQAIVYCLATNYLENIDVAAKRRGRFDFHIPVFDPDPISRAGLLMYRLYRLHEKIQKDAMYRARTDFKGRPARILEIIERTRHVHASSLAEDYLRLPDWAIDTKADLPSNYQNEIPLFWYVLTGEDLGYQRKVQALSIEQDNIEIAVEKFKTSLSSDDRGESGWVEDYDWLMQFEQHVSGKLKGDVSLQSLWDALRFNETDEAARRQNEKDVQWHTQLICTILCCSRS